jgi:hypothetical protein
VLFRSLRDARKTFRHTEESKKKISQAHMGHVGYNKGMPAWNKGLKMSDESRAKMSLSAKGRIPKNKGAKMVNGKYEHINVA